MDTAQSTLLTAPAPELESLSFAHPAPEAVGEWIGRLPMANVRETAGQIRQATFEIARLDTDWQTRMSLLEGIRPTVLYLAKRLDKAASSSHDQSDAIARLAQRLQTNLCSGFRAVVLAARDDAATDVEATRSVSLAVHRSIADLSKSLLRTLQFYVAPADHLWLKLNQLYLIAEQLGIEAEMHADAGNETGAELSISGAFIRALLLTLARPYQLRTSQLAKVFDALGGWVHMVSLSDADGDDRYMIDMESDQGPGYANNVGRGEAVRGIRSEVLVYELESHLRDGTDSIHVPSNLDDSLINHLTGAWGEMKPRAHGRSDSNTPIQVSIGMRASHYFLSGEVSFNSLLEPALATPAKDNPFISEEVRFLPNVTEKRRDVWEHAFDVGAKIPENPNFTDPDVVLYPTEPTSNPADDADDYRFFDTTAADMSPGGYRLRWNEPFPGNLQTGELIGLRDEIDPHWCIGVARWIRQDETGPFIGVELLAPKARPVAIRIVKSKGGPSEFQRAFLLPGLKPINRPPSLITPLTPFEPGQKVHLKEDGVQSTAQLGEPLLTTGSFNQFTFRVLDGYLEKPDTPPNMGDPVTFNKNQQSGTR